MKHQPMKFAAIEAIWNTEDADDFVLFALPHMDERSNRHEVAIPGLLGLIAGHADTPVRGLDVLSDEMAQQIRRDLAATRALENRTGQKISPQGAAGLLPNGSAGTDAQIAAAARAAIPSLPVVFWAFRVMIAAWAVLTLLTLLAVVDKPKADSARGRLLLWALLLALPLPWVATEAGWMVCEVGRQPWTVTGVLTTFRSGTLTLDAGVTGLRLLLVSLMYSGLFVLNVTLCLRHIRRGPQPLMTPTA
jgi:cytochrome d ubiquinol oxidase subunit I